MSIVRSYSVFCDGEEAPGHPCPMWYGDVTDSSHPRPAAEARRIAKRARWTRQSRGGRFVDLCEACSSASREGVTR